MEEPQLFMHLVPLTDVATPNNRMGDSPIDVIFSERAIGTARYTSDGPYPRAKKLALQSRVPSWMRSHKGNPATGLILRERQP